MALPITAYNVATANKWYMSFPAKIIDPDYSQQYAVFNIVSLTTPEFSFGTTTISLGGAEYPIAASVRNESKIISMTYKMSSNYHQFKYFYKWASLIIGEDGRTSHAFASYSVPITLTLLSEFKNPIFSITYHNAFLSRMDAIPFDYQGTADTITHRVDFQYSHYTVTEAT